MIGENAHNFLKENVTIDENGNARLTQKKFMEFMAANGITKEVMEAKSEADKELINGAYRFVNEKLTEKVNKVKAEGGDPSDASVSLAIGIPNGSINMDLTASKNYSAPRNPGETITKTNVCKLNYKQTRFLDKEMTSACEADMAKLLGLDK